MQNKFLTGIILVSCLLFHSSCSVAQTSAELDSAGMEHFNRAFYQLIPYHQDEEALKEFQLAEDAFSQAIRMEPQWVEPYLHLARTLFVQKKYMQAAEIYRKAAAIAPDREDIQLKLASALEMAGDYQAALDVLRQLRTARGRKGPEGSAVLDDLIQKMEKRAGGK